MRFSCDDKKPYGLILAGIMVSLLGASGALAQATSGPSLCPVRDVELIILIRPSVIRGSEDAAQVADELRSKLWGLGASQAR